MSDPAQPPNPVRSPTSGKPVEAEIVESEPAEAKIVEAGIVEAEIVENGAPAVPASVPPADYDEHGVPSLDYVRNKIEDRYATSIGATELAAETTESRTLDDQIAARDKAAKAKLDEIRKSLGPPPR
jgi:hypothetical protein